MKKAFLFISIVASIAAFSSCKLNQAPQAGDEAETVQSGPQKGDIVYFNLDQVINEYDMANDLRSVVETKVQNINEEVNRRGNKLQKKVNDFQEKINKGLLTRSVAEVQGQSLQQEQNEFQNYAAQKQQEIQEEQVVMMNNIADAIKTFVDNYNAEKGYALILTTQGDIMTAPVVTGDPELDITRDIIDGLNKAYVESKSKK
ncbi:MAG: OmpH family outer membrane protein [Bacteroidales bacterium]|nr:OmpH family outer membrane protein [Bacteroidales bacterium]